jgi:hypothetical protein
VTSGIDDVHKKLVSENVDSPPAQVGCLAIEQWAVVIADKFAGAALKGSDHE